MKESFVLIWQKELLRSNIWYVSGFAILTVLPLVLIIWVLAGHAFDSSSRASSLSGKRAQVVALSAELASLRDVSGDMADTGAAIEAFYSTRVPTSYSQLTSSIGAVAMQSGVQLAQATYSQGSPGSDLMEVSIDAGVNGSYRQIVRFVNGLERDHVFFVIRALSFAGQQEGTVNLRLRMSTWLRPNEEMRGRNTVARNGITATVTQVKTSRKGEK